MRMHLLFRRFCQVLLVFAGLAVTTAYAQVESRSLTPTKATHQPSMDNAADAAWSSASEIRGFKQREPFEGREATEKTSVRALYDKHSLYFLINCYDTEPRRIVATELRRDADLTVGDYFTILISPNHDGRKRV